MNRVVSAAVIGIVMAGAGAWWFLRSEPSPHPEAGLEEPLPMDETVELRWTDEETGEDEVWKVTKRATALEDRPSGPARGLPDRSPAS